MMSPAFPPGGELLGQELQEPLSWPLPWPPPPSLQLSPLRPTSLPSAVPAPKTPWLSHPEVTQDHVSYQEELLAHHELHDGPSYVTHFTGIGENLEFLARKYRSLRFLGIVMTAWQLRTEERKPLREALKRGRMILALRWWRRKAVASSWRQQLPLLCALHRLAATRLRGVLQRLRQPLLAQRQRRAQGKLLLLIRDRSLLWLALAQRRKTLMQRSFLALANAKLSPSSLEDDELPAESWKAICSNPPTWCLQQPGSVSFMGLSASRGALLDIQRAALHRWWKSAQMATPREVFAEERRQGLLLSVIHSRALATVAVCHCVKSLELRAFRAFQQNVLETPKPLGAAKTRRHLRHGHPVPAQGLRGTSTAEVLRKAWFRWRHTVAAGLWVSAPADARPANIRAVLSEVADHIGRVKAQDFGYFKAPAPSEPLWLSRTSCSAGGACTAQGSRVAQLPPPPPLRGVSASSQSHCSSLAGCHRQPSKQEPAHLTLLQQALDSFAYVTGDTLTVGC